MKSHTKVLDHDKTIPTSEIISGIVENESKF